MYCRFFTIVQMLVPASRSSEMADGAKTAPNLLPLKMHRNAGGECSKNLLETEPNLKEHMRKRKEKRREGKRRNSKVLEMKKNT